jgi:hypothetical protein
LLFIETIAIIHLLESFGIFDLSLFLENEFVDDIKTFFKASNILPDFIPAIEN